MKVLILGGDGMLGHQLLKQLQDEHSVYVTLRQDSSKYIAYKIFNHENSFFSTDVHFFDRIKELTSNLRPDAIINCVGIVKQREISSDWVPSLEINSLLPHKLLALCDQIGSRLIHISTDCIFSGNKGNYLETDCSDATDIYGKTKYLGEIDSKNCITLRTSIIGFELARKKSLLEWFINQSGEIQGYTNALYSGFTTIELSRIINNILLNHTNACGIYHVSSPFISKYDLLSLIKDALKIDISIKKFDDFHCNRTLNSEKFKNDFKYSPPSWSAMVSELSMHYKK